MKIMVINPAISSIKNTSVLPCRINDISVIFGMILFPFSGMLRVVLISQILNIKAREKSAEMHHKTFSAGLGVLLA